MPKLAFIRALDGLAPASEDARRWFAKHPAGEPVDLEVKTGRNVRHHRKFFALVHVAYEHWDKPGIIIGETLIRPNERVLVDHIKKRTGHYEYVVEANGTLGTRPLSISFAKMDQTAFENFYSKAIDVILSDILTDWTNEDVRRAAYEVARA